MAMPPESSRGRAAWFHHSDQRVLTDEHGEVLAEITTPLREDRASVSLPRLEGHGSSYVFVVLGDGDRLEIEYCGPDRCETIAWTRDTPPEELAPEQHRSVYRQDRVGSRLTAAGPVFFIRPDAGGVLDLLDARGRVCLSARPAPETTPAPGWTRISVCRGKAAIDVAPGFQITTRAMSLP